MENIKFCTKCNIVLNDNNTLYCRKVCKKCHFERRKKCESYITKHNVGRFKKLSQDEIKNIINDYNEKRSINKLCQKYKYSWLFLNKLLINELGEENIRKKKIT